MFLRWENVLSKSPANGVVAGVAVNAISRPYAAPIRVSFVFFGI